MGQIFNILNGWWNVIFKSVKIELIAIRRAKHCNDCEHKVFSKTINAFVKDELIEVSGFICGQCSCPLSAKTRSKNEQCPIGKW